MPIVNTSKPSTSVTNTTKVSFAELWSTITTTWATETRTWAETGSLIDNLTKVTDEVSLLLLESDSLLLTENDEGILLESSGGMINTSKP